jgi:sigma-B regulation protein RsbQ
MNVLLSASDVLVRNNVRTGGVPGGRPLVFVHGFACDQRMWRHITPHFEGTHFVVLLDQVGGGHSDITAYDPVRHGRLAGYADDLVEILEALDLRDAVIVGHSVGAGVAILAQLAAPERIGALVLVGPSPRYVDDPASGYVGGLSEEEVDGLLEAIELNFSGWADVMAPVIMGNEDRPELGAELVTTFCETEPEIAVRWARVSFLADIRQELGAVTVPSIVLQCSEDPIVPDEVGRWMADHLPEGRFAQLEATGHCPHLSAPEETADAIRRFLAEVG